MSCNSSTLTQVRTDSPVRPVLQGEPGYCAVENIRSHGLIAILRGLPPTHIVATATALVDAGITTLEITFDGFDQTSVSQVATGIRSVTEALGERVSIGAGSVLSEVQLNAARKAGARFIVSPDTNPRIIAGTREAGLASLPGAATASECVTAVNAGATFVKLFPAGHLGASYVSALLAPLPWLPLVAVGGVGIGNAEGFLRAGALALGVGGRLVDKTAIARGQYQGIREYAAHLVSVAREWRRQ